MTDTPPEMPTATMTFDSSVNDVGEKVQAEHEEIVKSLMHMAKSSWERGLVFAALTQGFGIGAANAIQVVADVHPEMDGEELQIAMPFTYRTPGDPEKIGSADADGDEDSRS